MAVHMWNDHNGVLLPTQQKAKKSGPNTNHSTHTHTTQRSHYIPFGRSVLLGAGLDTTIAKEHLSKIPRCILNFNCLVQFIVFVTYQEH